MKKHAIILFVSLVVLASFSASAVEVAPRITDKEIVERLTRLEEGQKTLNKRIDDLDKKLSARIDYVEHSLNKRIDDLRVEMNDRFASMDKRFDTLQWMLGLFITISLVILGFVLRMQWQLQRRQTKMEATLETHKDELAFLKSLIEKLIPPKEVL